jgi:hypothetical protein
MFVIKYVNSNTLYYPEYGLYDDGRLYRGNDSLSFFGTREETQAIIDRCITYGDTEIIELVPVGSPCTNMELL